MKAFLKNILFILFLSIIISAPLSYLFVKDIVQPKIIEILEPVEQLTQKVSEQNIMIENFIQSQQNR